MEKEKKQVTVICYGKGADEISSVRSEQFDYQIHVVEKPFAQTAYIGYLTEDQSDWVCVLDTDRISAHALNSICSAYDRQPGKQVGFYAEAKSRYFIPASVRTEVMASPFLIGRRQDFEKAYVGNELAEDPIAAVAYSLQKRFVSCRRITVSGGKIVVRQQQENLRKISFRYLLKIPYQYLISGDFFKNMGKSRDRGRRELVYRLLMMVLALGAFIYMPSVSGDYGISGDESQYYQHAGYVLDHYLKGDSSVFQPSQRYLRYYGIVMHTVSEVVCRAFDAEDYHAVRHGICAATGALGVLFAGLLGLRLGGGLCGLFSLLLMFFTPRFFGHSMNNLTDIPFAVGYLISVFYTIRLFDYYPQYRIRDMAGLVGGIVLALGTRSGGLVIFPMMLMYAGLYYLLYYGIKEFYKFYKYRKVIGDILFVLLVTAFIGYILSILLWPYAMQRPFSNVFVSLKEFTNFSIGLRTIFEGKQMMSNMLPWNYAPQYLLIAMPVVTIIGFLGYFVYILLRRKEFSLPAFFLLFAAIFPVFWVIYKNSNLYGGIRHLLFVMPMLVVLAAYFWSRLMTLKNKWVDGIVVVLVLVGIALPARHMIRNHPYDYIYFNEFVGGVRGAYGDYETDYYYNSLKQACEWFCKQVPLSPDKTYTVVTNHEANVKYYLRKYPNIQVKYARYYEKYSKEWDYALFANVYINRAQLKQGIFPPQETIYMPEVDGLPMSVVLKRDTKETLEGFDLMKQRKYTEAISVFEHYIKDHPHNEEVLSQLCKMYYLRGDWDNATKYGKLSLQMHPTLNATLYVMTLVYLQQKDYSNAMASAQGILNENELSPDGYYLRALVFDALGKYQEAIKDINKTLAYRPKHDGALSLGAEILFKNANYQGAASTYEKLLAVKKTVPALSRLADCYVRMKNYKVAEKILQEIQQVKPGDFDAYKVMTRMYIQEKQWHQVGILLKQTEGFNNDAELFVLRALYWNGVGQAGNAQQMLEYALKLEPDNREGLALQRAGQQQVQLRAQ